MKKSHESAEDYLENILILRERNGNVRSIDKLFQAQYQYRNEETPHRRLCGDGSERIHHSYGKQRRDRTEDEITQESSS